MKNARLCLFPVSLLALLATAILSNAGDVIKLKTGVKLEGKILSESATEVKIEVMLGSIKDVQGVPRKDIAEIIKATPDQIEAAALGLLVPSQDGMSDNAYQSTLTEKLEPFLKKYPTSPARSQVEAVIKTYQEEMTKAKSGATKLEGVWIPSAELKWNAYNIEARRRRIELQKSLKAGNYGDAAQILAELELNKPASVETFKSLQLFKDALPDFEKTLTRLVEEHPIKIKSRDTNNKTLTPEQLARVKEAIREEEAALKVSQETARKNKTPIPPFSEWDLKSIKDAQVAVVKEKARIAKLDFPLLKATAEKFQTGLQNLEDKSYLSAERNFIETAKVYPKDLFVKDRAEYAKKAASEAARAAAEASAAKPKPAVATASSDKSKSGTTAKTAAPTAVKKTATASSEEDTDTPPAKEESSNMPMYLIGGAAALLVTLLGAKALTKKKGSPDDD